MLWEGGVAKMILGAVSHTKEIIIVSKNGMASAGVSSQIAGFASHAAVSRTHTQKRREQTGPRHTKGHRR